MGGALWRERGVHVVRKFDLSHAGPIRAEGGALVTDLEDIAIPPRGGPASLGTRMMSGEW